VNHFTYGIVSDGDLMEGLSHEAASLAGHLGLGKLIYFYDDNHISIEGGTDLTFTENRTGRFVAYGWHVQRVTDGNNLKALEQAVREAQNQTTRPSLIAVRTNIGFGSPNKQDTAKAHGEPLGEAEIRLTKENLNWPPEPNFLIPQEALSHFRMAIEKGKALEDQWQNSVRTFKHEHAELADEWERWLNGEMPQGWQNDIPIFPADAKGMATRVSSGIVLNAIASKATNLIGGSADLAPSNKTLIEGEADYQANDFSGRNMRFGVREHAMGSILNAMALHGGLIPYGGTFLVFSDYMRPAIRLAALSELKVIYVFTHDSIGLGEDGPTHQPIEHLAALRAIPNLTVIRPGDANETAQAWQAALNNQNGPVALALTRQNVATLDREIFSPAQGLHHGAYILSEAEGGEPDVILIASGSEVDIVLKAAEKLKQGNLAVRVVSMPSWELFEKQPENYRRQVFPDKVKAKIAVEAGSPQGWDRYVGESGEVIGLNHFGASAPFQVLYEKFGITAEHVVETAMALVEKLKR
jgi:transketolase